MQNPTPKISDLPFSVVTVNYNGLDDTCALVESLKAHVTTPHEIVVVDNGSRTDEAAILRERYPDIRVVRSEVNLGFAGGNNLGFREATGRHLLMLNNDTVVEEDTLGKLAELLDLHPEIGAVSPKIRFEFPPRDIQFAGYTPLSRITLRNGLIGFGQADAGQYDTPQETPYTHGAAMMVRREALEKAGLMPELYFLYYEELDWCTRMTDAGFTLRYEPSATVFHKESRSTGQGSPLRTYYITRNRLLYAQRNRHGATRMLAILYQLTLAVPKEVLKSLLKGKPSLAWAVCRGCRDFFRIKGKTADISNPSHLPGMTVTTKNNPT